MASKLIRWSPGRVRLTLELPEDAPVRLAALRGAADGPDVDPPARRQPLVELLILGEGHALSNTRFSDTAVGSRLRYTGSKERTDGPWREMRVRQRDPVTEQHRLLLQPWPLRQLTRTAGAVPRLLQLRG